MRAAERQQSLLGGSAVDAREDMGCFGGRLFVFPCGALQCEAQSRGGCACREK